MTDKIIRVKLLRSDSKIMSDLFIGTIFDAIAEDRTQSFGLMITTDHVQKAKDAGYMAGMIDATFRAKKLYWISSEKCKIVKVKFEFTYE